MGRSTKTLSDAAKLLIWGKSAGRCNICNQSVYEDHQSLVDLKHGEHAHIIAASDDGPRGHPFDSDEYAADPDNIILLCGMHHTLVDQPAFLAEYPVARLRDLKARHEARIGAVTSVVDEKKSHVLLYSANIAAQSNPVNYKVAAEAMLANGRYSADRLPFQIHLTGNPLTDASPDFWQREAENLFHHFQSSMKSRIDRQQIEHLSIFALAPIPLLMYLGTLLTDKMPADVYQLHREPPTWKWLEGPPLNFIVTPPETIRGTNVALSVSLSGKIANSDVEREFDGSVDLWTIEIEEPYNDFLKSEAQLAHFREQFRKVLNAVKEKHGDQCVLNIFPAVPVAVAIEMGRVWMPKADLPMVIFDRMRERLTFVPTLTIPIADK